MRKLTKDAVAVLVGLAIVLAFALGLLLGAKVQEGLDRTVASETRR